MARNTPKVSEKSDELRAVEAELGFTFGLPDDGHESAHASRGVSVVCTNPDCDQTNVHVTLHADTVLPVFCGSCGRVLHCEHEDLLPVQVHGGTLGQPTRTTNWTCLTCQTVVRSEVQVLPPIDIASIPVADIPAAVAMAAARQSEGIA